MKTTKKQFNQFKRWFNHYVELFGLQRYKIIFRHTELEDAYAEIYRDDESSQALVNFNKTYEEGLNIKITALHEALHLLHSTLVYVAKNRFTTPIEIQLAEEQVVRILEKVIGQ